MSLEVINPWTGKIVRRYRFMAGAQVEALLARSRAGFIDWFWRSLDQRGQGSEALAAGNVALIERAITMPGCADAIAGLVDDAGLPAGVPGMLQIDNAAALARHRRGACQSESRQRSFFLVPRGKVDPNLACFVRANALMSKLSKLSKLSKGASPRFFWYPRQLLRRAASAPLVCREFVRGCAKKLPRPTGLAL